MTRPCILMLIIVIFDLRVSRAQELLLDERALESGTNELLVNFVTGHGAGLTGHLNASKDLFQKTTAYEFSAAFFRPRGLASSDQTVLLNGVRLNKPVTGRMEWSNVGGLNDALRYQEIFGQQQSSPYWLGGSGPMVNLNSYAENYGPGMKYSLAFSNRSYKHRWMLSYFSNWTERNWKINVSGSGRMAGEGFRQGTNYDSYAFQASVDKKLQNGHHLNGTFIWVDTRSGRSAPLTMEVYRMKGVQYNPNWGMFQGRKRNARQKRIAEPLLQLNHRWQINEKSLMENHLTLQFGESSRSRLDYSGSRMLQGLQGSIGGGVNPDPTYYQYLPSYFLRRLDSPDFQGAHLSREEFLRGGQLPWDELIADNSGRADRKNAVYALYEDRVKGRMLNLQSEWHKIVGARMSLDVSLSYAFHRSNNHARLLDLLGGSYYLDVSNFEDRMEQRPNDLDKPERKVLEGQKLKYDYDLNIAQLTSYARLSFRGAKTEFYTGLQVGNTSYSRIGHYENGRNPGSMSLGKGPKTSFFHPGLKFGLTHKLTGRHLIGVDAAYLHLAPAVQNSYYNIRESHARPDRLKVEKQTALDAFYLLRGRQLQGKISLYHILVRDRSRVSFYYADGLMGLEHSGGGIFVQELLLGAGAQSSGIELSLAYQFRESLLFKAVGVWGRAQYAIDPELLISSDELPQTISLGRAHLKGYDLGSGPRTAISLGFEYSDPDYWWFSLTANLFDRSYVQVAPVLRTQNFITGQDQGPVYGLDPELAKALLEQEKLPAYWTLNLVGGKSWRIGKNYLGFFASLSNVLNTIYRTGGFEQSRNANYVNLLEDKMRDYPMFGNKYWFGYGASYFASLYFRM